MFWFVGFILFCIYRVFNAGMNSKSLFYRGPKYSFEDKGLHFDEGKLFTYAAVTFGIGITWPLSVPLIGTYLLGKRFAKDTTA